MKLRRYQDRGADFLSSKRVALLADEMGLGKTAQAIRAADLTESRRTMVVCPAVVRRQWVREIEKFSSRELAVKTIETSKDTDFGDADVLVISYDLCVRMRTALQEWRPDVVILDEAHFLRNHEAKRTISLLGGGAAGRQGICKDAKHVWFLTGTPNPNSLLDYYTYLRFSGVLSGSFPAFRKKFVKGYEGQHGFVVTRNFNVIEFKRLRDKVQLRRTRRSVGMELPPISFEELIVEPSESPFPGEFILDKLPLIDAQLAEAYEEFLETGKYAKPTQIATLRKQLGLLKVIPACQIIDEQLRSIPGSKALVFGIHTLALKYAKAFLYEHYDARLVFGGTAPWRKAQYVDRFQTRPGMRALVGHLTALGVGANITAADTVYILEPSWLPDENRQAISRAYRYGQARKVNVRFVGVAGTIDEKIAARLAEREWLVDEARG